MGVKSDDTICDLWDGIPKGGCVQIKDRGWHHDSKTEQKNESSLKTLDAGIEVKVSKQRSSDKKIVSHQIGVATHQHELAIENYLQKSA
jgi:hypothetical protein